MTEELRKKYIAKNWEDPSKGYYSYVHVGDLDKLFSKVEELEKRVIALEVKPTT